MVLSMRREIITRTPVHLAITCVKAKCLTDVLLVFVLLLLLLFSACLFVLIFFLCFFLFSGFLIFFVPVYNFFCFLVADGSKEG